MMLTCGLDLEAWDSPLQGKWSQLCGVFGPRGWRVDVVLVGSLESASLDLATGVWAAVLLVVGALDSPLILRIVECVCTRLWVMNSVLLPMVLICQETQSVEPWILCVSHTGVIASR